MAESALATLFSPTVTETLRRVVRPTRSGEVIGARGNSFDVSGLDLAVGDVIELCPTGNADGLVAQVISTQRGQASAMPLTTGSAPRVGDAVRFAPQNQHLDVGDALLGRVIDALGRPLDDRPLHTDRRIDVHSTAPDPLRRLPIGNQLQLGVRALDTLVPCGTGQRLGIFAGAGVGKSTLLSMIVRNTTADVVVVGLIGERGREVREFLERDLGPEGMAKAVVVVATSDSPALVRARAAATASRVAEWYRDEGANVLLVMDSLTRFVMAHRELALAAGELPAARGYPASALAQLAPLLERAGNSDRGHLTALYTVLVEGDELAEPVADTARSILDGHIVLSRKLAQRGHYPAIDVLDSISRVEGQILHQAQRDVALAVRGQLAAFAEAQDLIEVGAYAEGSNPAVDEALKTREAVLAFLRQSVDEPSRLDHSWSTLESIVRSPVMETL